MRKTGYSAVIPAAISPALGPATSRAAIATTATEAAPIPQL